MNWETFNTPKIKTVYKSDPKDYSSTFSMDFGSKIRYKCHLPIHREKQTGDGETCLNWKLIDSFGVRLDLDETIHHTDDYKEFYDDPPEVYVEEAWIKKYATVNHRSHQGQNGFVLSNGIFERFEPVGVTWNDSYCRRLSVTGHTGCYVERDLSIIADFDYEANNCTG